MLGVDIGEFSIRLFIDIIVALYNSTDISQYKQIVLPALYWIYSFPTIREHILGKFKGFEEVLYKLKLNVKGAGVDKFPFISEDKSFLGFAPLDIFLLKNKIIALDNSIINEEDCRDKNISTILNSFQISEPIITKPVQISMSDFKEVLNEVI
jgi:hypothetical protein